MRLRNELPNIKIIYCCASASSSSALSSLTHTDYRQVKTGTRRKKSRVSAAHLIHTHTHKRFRSPCLLIGRTILPTGDTALKSQKL